MSRSPAGRLPMKRAFAVSIALHVLLLALVAPFSLRSGAANEEARPAETSTVAYLTLERRPKPERHYVVVRRVVAAQVRQSAPVLEIVPPRAAVSHVLRPRSLAPPVAQKTSSRAGPAPAVVGRRAEERRPSVDVAPLVRVTSIAPARAQIRGVAPPVPAPSPAPPSAPAPAREQVAVAGVDVPAGGWGQSFERPLVADDAALATLRARYHAAGAVRIDVDETGRALKVSIPNDTPEDVRTELERRLLELRYVPAECNGLRCSGTLQLEI